MKTKGMGYNLQYYCYSPRMKYEYRSTSDPLAMPHNHVWAPLARMSEESAYR